ncbi:MAG: hypothetical protein ACE5GV_15905, partial [Candidatus Scalindua sp.]
QVRETKDEAMARVNAANNAANNGANNNTNSNAAIDQSKVIKTDTVEVSKKSVEFASTTATKSGSKVQESVDKLAKANEKAQDQRENARKAMKKNQQELRHLVKGLRKLGVGSSKVSSIIKNANRKANKVIGKEIKQAYNDYRSYKTNKQSFYNKLYGAAVKKLYGIVSALRNAYDQKAASTQTQTVTVKPIETMDPLEPVKKTDDGDDKNAERVKETANATKEKETNVVDADSAAKANAEKNTEKAKEAANAPATPLGSEASQTAKDNAPGPIIAEEKVPETTPLGQVVVEEEATATTTSELIVKEEKVVAEAGGEMEVSKIVNDGGEADNTFSQIVDIFNGIDKMINGFADKVEGEDSNVEDKGQGLVNFASRLSDMFSGINRAFGNQSNGGDVGNKLGIAQVNKETISQPSGNGHGNETINSIGGAGEGSGNVNAVSLFSLSNNISAALDSYKDVQKTENESKDAVGVLA